MFTLAQSPQRRSTPSPVKQQQGDSAIPRLKQLSGFYLSNPLKQSTNRVSRGFYLVRELRALGVDCIVGAVSKMQKPSADKRRKNDRVDAEFLARLLSTQNITEVFVPDEECEAMRDIARVLEDIRDDLARAKQRLAKFLLRHGYVFDEVNDKGQRKGNWTQAHWIRIRKIEFEESADEESFAYCKTSHRIVLALRKRNA